LSHLESDLLVEVKVKLPRYLAEWLHEFAQEIAMTPGQLLTHILHYYYEAYLKGLTKGEERTCWKLEELATESSKQKVVDLTILAKKFIEENKSMWNTFIVRGFVSWLQSKNILIPTLEHVNDFLMEYQKSHSPSKRSLSSYKGVLIKFVKYVEQHISDITSS